MGISIYFKQLKNLITVLLICTILSMPSFYLYTVGNDISSEEAIQASSLNKFLASLSIGSIGDRNDLQLSYPLRPYSQPHTLNLFCLTGTIGAAYEFGMATKVGETSTDLNGNSNSNANGNGEAEIDVTEERSAEVQFENVCKLTQNEAPFREAYVD